jgi:hypothetical protein
LEPLYYIRYTPLKSHEHQVTHWYWT